MNENYYLVDNNALVALTSKRIRGEFFSTYCRVTTDVLREAQSHPEHPVLESVSLKASARGLERIRDVMRRELVGATDLVDLYANKGAADPGLIATLELLTEDQLPFLIPDNWTMVTNDAAVSQRAQTRSINVISPQSLVDLVDQFDS